VKNTATFRALATSIEAASEGRAVKMTLGDLEAKKESRPEGYGAAMQIGERFDEERGS
jgi:hypothetical protein